MASIATRRQRDVRRPWLAVVGVGAGAAALGWAAGWLGLQLSNDPHPTWLLARVAGLASLVMLTGLVTLGLLLAYPRGTVLRALPRDVLIRVHIGLATFTLVFTVLHVVVLALDKYAGVGWAGVFLPLGATYRPIPVTLGWIALYGGLLAGVTARLAGRLGRVWWPIHRVAIVTYAAAWLHGVLAGTDSVALAFFYGSSLLIVVSIATSRYLTEPTRHAEVSAR